MAYEYLTLETVFWQSIGSSKIQNIHTSPLYAPQNSFLESLACDSGYYCYTLHSPLYITSPTWKNGCVLMIYLFIVKTIT